MYIIDEIMEKNKTLLFANIRNGKIPTNNMKSSFLYPTMENRSKYLCYITYNPWKYRCYITLFTYTYLNNSRYMMIYDI